jgi:hypothetical protein
MWLIVQLWSFKNVCQINYLRGAGGKSAVPRRGAFDPQQDPMKYLQAYIFVFTVIWNIGGIAFSFIV